MGVCADSDPALAWTEFIRLGQRVIDVGAHVGTYTREFARRVGPKGTVHAIEPGPKLFDRLRLEVSDLLNVKLYRYALGNMSGEHRVFHFQNWTLLPVNEQDPRYYSRSYVLNQDQTLKEEFPVLFMTMDEFVAKNGPADWIKVDVDGAELEVLRGASMALRDIRPYWVLEVGKYTMAYFGSTPKDLTSLMESYGYRLYDYQTYKEMSADQVEAVIPDSTIDVICAPEERPWPP